MLTKYRIGIKKNGEWKLDWRLLESGFVGRKIFDMFGIYIVKYQKKI